MTQELCNHLREKFDRKHAFFVGRATTGIELVLNVLFDDLRETSPQKKKVLMPAIACPNPAFAIQYAGFTPQFVDVRLEEMNADWERGLKEIPVEEIAAVVLIHLYGYPISLEPLRRLLPGVPIIEDVAQGLGAKIGGRLCGSLGDFSVLSFGGNKILEAEGGGAILTDDDTMAQRLKSCVEALPERSPNYDALSESYRQIYYGVQKLNQSGVDGTGLFYSRFAEAFRSLYRFAGQESQAKVIERALGSLERDVEERRKKASLYRAHLKHARFVHPEFEQGAEPAFWRYSLRYEGERDLFCERVRKLGVDVSPWYPSLVRWFEPNTARPFPHAEKVEKQVINLWTNASVSEEQIVRNCEILNREADR